MQYEQDEFKLKENECQGLKYFFNICQKMETRNLNVMKEVDKRIASSHKSFSTFPIKENLNLSSD